jgi:hypothetical protein
MNIAAAIPWAIWRRHRWIFIGIAIYLALAVTALRGVPLFFDWIPALFPDADPREVAAAIGVCVVIIPCAFIACFLLAAFAYGFEIDLAGRESSFPSHMLTLPASTAALAGWPALYGVAAMALFYWALTWGVLRPCGLITPWLWPAALFAVMMTWIQALAWSAFALRWLRVAVAMVVLPIPLMITGFGLNVFGMSHEMLAALLTCLVPLGFFAAWRGLARVRRGDVPEWTWLASLGELNPRRGHQRRAFASPHAAQRWFEWRRHGIALPLMVTLLTPLMLFPLLLGPNDALPTARILLPLLFIPPLMAGSAAAAVGKHNPWVRDYYGLPPFTATRPLTTAALIAAKFRTALRSTLIAWLIVLLGTVVAVAPSHAARDVQAWWQVLVEHEGTFKAAALVATVAFMLVLLTWKRLVENQTVGLTGREWLIKGTIVGGLCVYSLLGLLASWMYVYPDFRENVVTALPWLLACAVALKAVLAVWVLRSLQTWGLIDVGRLSAIAFLWLAAAGGLFGLLLWLVPPGWVSWPYLGAVAVMIVPLVRPAAAPLALAWNRHR